VVVVEVEEFQVLYQEIQEVLVVELVEEVLVEQEFLVKVIMVVVHPVQMKELAEEDTQL
tara:strand:- start:194 stop:370 length:177 start_codon:yes stop_codon:yes gene_type:complete